MQEVWTLPHLSAHIKRSSRRVSSVSPVWQRNTNIRWPGYLFINRRLGVRANSLSIISLSTISPARERNYQRSKKYGFWINLLVLFFFDLMDSSNKGGKRISFWVPDDWIQIFVFHKKIGRWRLESQNLWLQLSSRSMITSRNSFLD